MKHYLFSIFLQKDILQPPGQKET